MSEPDAPDIWKEALVGFLVTRCKTEDRGSCGKYHFVHMSPLVAECESGGLSHACEAMRLNSDYEIIGVLPAAPGSVAVVGSIPNTKSGVKFEILGYEIPGLSAKTQADWEAERQGAIKSWDKIAAQEASEETSR